jgi:UDP-3-O-[3-hydroxymyristoyl] glucosamine N-acyltransferase
LKLKDLAERLACRLDGDGEIDIERVAGIDRAQAGDLTFLANARYRPHLASTKASAIIVPFDVPAGATVAALLRSDGPAVCFAEAIRLLRHVSQPPAGVDSTAQIAPDASVHASASIGPFVSIGRGALIGERTVIYPHVTIGEGATLGDDCVVHARVSIREGVRIGHRVVLQDGAVVGSDGFGFAKRRDGTHLKIPQLADVVIEDDVEIGANSTVDRPAVGETRIGAGTKIDNLVQIGHGVTIGSRVLFAAQVGIAGSCVIEDDVILAGQVGVANHVRLGKGVLATAQTGIPNSVDAGGYVSGYPAIDHREWLKSSAVYRQLPALRKRVADLEQRIAELEEKLAECVKPSGQ